MSLTAAAPRFFFVIAKGSWTPDQVRGDEWRVEASATTTRTAQKLIRARTCL